MKKGLQPPKRIAANLFNGRYYRSSWERKFAEWLTKRGLRFEYEKYYFPLPNRTRYYPDFYIIEWDKFIEIKGWDRPEAIRKWNLFKTTYPQINIEKWMKEELTTLGVL